MIKTRSQLTLPDFNFNLLGRSPLKQARTALRSAESSTQDQSSAVDEGTEERDPKHPKRSSSTFKDAEIPRERASKRVKRVPFPSEDSNDEEVRSDHAMLDNKPLASSSNPFVSRKPSSTVSLPPAGGKSGRRHTERSPRSQSVPFEPTLPTVAYPRIPRTPAKPSSQLFDFSSVPLAEAMQPPPAPKLRIVVTETPTDEDVTMTSVFRDPASFRSSPALDSDHSRSHILGSDASIPTSPLTPLSSTPAPVERMTPLYRYRDTEATLHDMEASSSRTTPRPRTPSTNSKIPQPSVFPIGSSFSRTTPVTPKRGVVSRMKGKSAKNTPESAVGASKPKTASEVTPKALQSAALQPQALSREDDMTTPTSTSHVAKSTVLETVIVPSENRPAEVQVTAVSPSKKSILLEGSVDMEIPLNDTTEDEDLKMKRALSPPATVVGRSKKPASTASTRAEIPLGGRMTRSASLRQKENKKNIDAMVTGVSGERGSGSRPNSRSSPRSKTPAPSAVSSSSSTVMSNTTPGRKRAMSLSSVARPTLSSAAKSNPPTPAKPRPPASMIVSRSSGASASDTSSGSTSAMSTSRPATSMSMSHVSTKAPRPQSSVPAAPTNSSAAKADAKSKIPSLSTLSIALQKLNTRPPSRPNSSDAFNRPNTSLGFNREKGGGLASDSDDEEGDSGTRKANGSSSTKTAGGSKDDSHVGKSMVKAMNGNTESKPIPMKRASTVGPSAYIGLKPGKLKQSTLMLPPPIPKARRASEMSDGETSDPGTAKKRINVNTGMTSGKTRGGFSFGVGPSKPRFGVARLPGTIGPATGNRNRVAHRVSKQSTLPTVEGSPAKPSGGDMTMADATEQSEADADGSSAGHNKGKGKAQDDSAPGLSRTFDIEAIRAMVREEVEAEDAEDDAEDSGPRSPDKWRLNASRRASAASHLLSQSMSAMPQTPQRKIPATEGKGKSRAASSGYPQSSINQQTAPGVLGRAKGVGARVSANTRGMAAAAAADAGTNSPSSDVQDEPKKSTPDSSSKVRTDKRLKILKDCRIFVDVRTDDGDDASALFVDMLQKLGAKLLSAVGRSCTHIVYKNGLMSTLTRYRLHGDPKPLVVGIAWVVECAEQAKHADESRFLVNLEGTNVAGANKRRRSMLPKDLTNVGSEPSSFISPGQTTSNDSSLEINSPASDDAAANSSLDSDLTPLERARRKHSSLFAAWGR